MLKTIQRTRLPVWAKQRLPATQTRLTVCTSSASTAMSTSANAATTSCMSNPCPPFPTRATVEVDQAPLMTWESHQKKRSTIDPSKRWRCSSLKRTDTPLVRCSTHPLVSDSRVTKTLASGQASKPWPKGPLQSQQAVRSTLERLSATSVREDRLQRDAQLASKTCAPLAGVASTTKELDVSTGRGH